MKTIIVLLLITMNTAVFSQINLEHTYTQIDGIDLKPVYLSHSGTKYFLFDSSTNTFKLYNLNHSIFKSFSIPFNPNYAYNGDIIFISEDLFDTDSTNIEYLRTGATNGIYVTEIISENGNIMFSRDSSNANIIVTDSGFKMALTITDFSSYENYEVYSLPGYLPSLCCNNINYTGININNDNINQYKLTSFPNPANDFTQIEFELPNTIKEGNLNFYNLSGILVKSFKVDNTFKSLRVTTNDLQAGTYLYSVQSNNKIIGCKKLVIIK